MIRKISTKTGGLLLGGGALLTALGFGFMPSAVWQQFRADVAKFREEIAQKVDDATRGTPLFGSGDFLRKSKAPPVEVTHPSTNPGTLAGPVIRGTSGEEGMLLPDGSFRKEGQRVLERVLEDPKLKKGFVEDLAEYLANGFYPEAQGGRFTITLFSVNRYCGARMNTETGGGRSALMSYVFQPTMLRGLYHLYLRTFLENLAEKASLRCSKRELEQFYTELILKLNELALGLKAILQQPDFELQLASYEKLAEACESINAKVVVAGFDLDELALAESSQGEQEMLGQHLSDLKQEYAKASKHRDLALRKMMESLHAVVGENLDDETLLFLALWVKRRIDGGSNGREGVKTSVEILEDLSERLRELAKGRLPGDFSKAEEEAVMAKLNGEAKPMRASLVNDEELGSKPRPAAVPKDVKPSETLAKPQPKTKELASEAADEAQKEKESMGFNGSKKTKEAREAKETKESKESKESHQPLATERAGQSQEIHQEEQGELTPNDGLPPTIQIPIR